ncbi:LytTR family DNA-binding domain-containing protein [Aliikangiella sp. G2MR2-5]|uniref:LytR/AlgR family response regulator transcription factor n=1 Tax=Aliikangiella sp. G2MR2-5 TaxID=2788943 RepID=UPI0018AB5F25|nr:LytTR family DNA-binding domain-containing protein [Aliikangiella sp. G2MR2-5]
MSRLKHYQQYHVWYEILAIVIFFAINNTILATSVIMEEHRDGSSDLALWEPFVWEYSSAISTMLLIWPLVRFLRKCPFNWTSVGYSLLLYFIASVIFSLSHIALMVLIRKLVYWWTGGNYDFGDLGYELVYEYRKDLWSFVFLIFIYHGYAYISSQLLGEANLVQDGEEQKATPDCERLLVKKLGKEFIIKVSEIEWLESSGNYVNLHVAGRIYPMRSTLNRLVEQIAEKGFYRIHRSYAVNLDQIDSITPLGSGDSEVKLNNGKVLNLSRRYKDGLKELLH